MSRSCRLTLALVLCCGTASAQVVYLNEFEDGDVEPDIGSGWSTNGLGTGEIATADNPAPDGVNDSSTVARFSVPNPDTVDLFKVRAEMYAGRYPTDGATYRYGWSVFIPDDFFEGATFHNVDASTNYWLALSQWSTWPCEVCNNERYGSRICGGCGGIFNDAGVRDQKDVLFRWRAEPDCYEESVPLVVGRWVRYELLTHWTMDDTGYSYLWQDGVLIRSLEGIKTLFDSWEPIGHDDEGNVISSSTGPRSCEMYWAVGIYSKWGGSKDEVFLYVDDVEIAEESGPPNLGSGGQDASGTGEPGDVADPGSVDSSDDSTAGGSGDGTSDGTDSSESGCSCRAAPRSPGPLGWLGALLALGVMVSRRRRTA